MTARRLFTGVLGSLALVILAAGCSPDKVSDPTYNGPADPNIKRGQKGVGGGPAGAPAKSGGGAPAGAVGKD